LGESTSVGGKPARTEWKKCGEDGHNSAGPTVARKPPVLPPEITLGALIAWLQSENVSGLIIGGVAASLLGRPRFTRDVDVLILLDDDRWEKFLGWRSLRFCTTH